MGYIIDTVYASDFVPKNYKRIEQPYKSEDDSLITSARILLGNRLRDNETLKIVSGGCVTFDLFSAITNFENDALYVYTISDPVLRKQQIGLLKDKFNFEALNKLGRFINEEVYEFINKEIRTSIVITAKNGLSTLQKLQVGIPILFPWYFENSPLSDLEKKFISIILKNDALEYMNFVSKLAESEGIKAKAIEEFLESYSERIKSRSIGESKTRIAELKESIEQQLTRLSDMYQTLERENVRLSGLESGFGKYDAFTDLKGMLKRNKDIEVQPSSSDEIIFIASGFIEHYDPDYAERLIHNRNSVLYKKIEDEFIDDYIKLYEWIFIKGILKIKVCAAYSMDPIRMTVRGIPSYQYQYKYNYFLKNPHIDRYACLGSYSMEMIKAVKNGMYENVILMFLASAKSLNFADSTVIGEFANRMSLKKSKFIMLPNGNMVNCLDAIKYIKDNEGE